MSCQQLLGNSKYRRVEVKGVGTVRLRAYAKGPATKNSPVRVTTQITRGKAKKVTYKLDGRKLKSKRKGRWNAVITPQKLQRIGVHKLVATVKGKKKKAKKVLSLKLTTVTCRTLFTAQRWRTFSGAGLRLRIDSRSAMEGISFKVPGVLLPRQVKAKRTIGFMRVFVAGESRRRRYSLKLAPKGKKTLLVRGAGKPTVKLGKGKITVGRPARARRGGRAHDVPPQEGRRRPEAQRLQAEGAHRAHGPDAEGPHQAPALGVQARTQRVSDTSVSWSAPTTASTRPPARSPEMPRPSAPPAMAATSIRSNDWWALMGSASGPASAMPTTTAPSETPATRPAGAAPIRNGPASSAKPPSSSRALWRGSEMDRVT